MKDPHLHNPMDLRPMMAPEPTKDPHHRSIVGLTDTNKDMDRLASLEALHEDTLLLMGQQQEMAELQQEVAELLLLEVVVMVS
ncbi:hypothetical protein GUJ93_ZPchr0007g4635 [Zizania palustris]|uniref:Uncharacterized protein n=1 Tax=Zizania palustris TaxID=103762 RepID=A0A8J5TGR1_ZIZPA|nr:hypothetical protein GUJ93_ZPchr0007g4635 [Zizania palustris]